MHPRWPIQHSGADAQPPPPGTHVGRQRVQRGASLPLSQCSSGAGPPGPANPIPPTHTRASQSGLSLVSTISGSVMNRSLCTAWSRAMASALGSTAASGSWYLQCSSSSSGAARVVAQVSPRNAHSGTPCRSAKERVGLVPMLAPACTGRAWHPRRSRREPCQRRCSGRVPSPVSNTPPHAHAPEYSNAACTVSGGREAVASRRPPRPYTTRPCRKMPGAAGEARPSRPTGSSAAAAAGRALPVARITVTPAAFARLIAAAEQGSALDPPSKSVPSMSSAARRMASGAAPSSTSVIRPLPPQPSACSTCPSSDSISSAAAPSVGRGPELQGRGRRGSLCRRRHDRARTPEA